VRTAPETTPPPAIDPRSWAAPRPSGLRRRVPILRWLPAYEPRLLRYDVVAGATLWGLLVPEMIAYAGLAGLPPQAGLYTLLVTLAAYAVFGTGRFVVVAGTSAGAVLLASGVASVSPTSPAEYTAAAAMLVLFCAGLFVLAGLLRLGFIARFLSRPVMAGFVFGLAVFVTVKQLPKLFGVAAGDGDTVQQAAHLGAHLGETSAATLAVGAGALALLFGADRLRAHIPGGVLVLVAGIAVSKALDLSAHGVAIVGSVPAGLPSVGIPTVDTGDLKELLAAAAGMALVIFSESLGVAEEFAARHGDEVDPDQELVALGVANAGSALVGGLAAGGSLSQSAVNEAAGARSEVSPLVATALSLVTVLVLMPVFTDLPEAVLAALIIHAVSHLWKTAEFRRYYHRQRLEFWIGLATLLGVITLDVLRGILIGVVSMVLLLLFHVSRPRIGVLGRVPGVPDAYGDLGRHPDYEPVPGLLILRLEAPLFYANAAVVADRVRAVVGAAEPVPAAVILDGGAIEDLDITSAEVVDTLVHTLHSAGVDFALADVREFVLDTARRVGVLDTIGADHTFHTIDEAVRALAPRAQREGRQPVRSPW
jgi:high affinity sulfate transporter 1